MVNIGSMEIAQYVRLVVYFFPHSLLNIMVGKGQPLPFIFSYMPFV